MDVSIPEAPDTQRAMMLSLRLAAVARHVLPAQGLADVGTDHGQLPVSLLLEDRISHAIASDRRPAPLEGARRLAASRRLAAPRFQARLSDGLAHLRAEDSVATVTICGMGGALIASILAAHPPAQVGVQRLVLQPNNAPEVLRSALDAAGWGLEDEDFVREGGYSYPILIAAQGRRSLSETEALLGPVLLRRRPPDFLDWLREEVERTQAILDRAEAAAEGESPALERLRHRVGLLRDALS